jgi:DNA-binding NtrC family response regulator
MLRRRPPGKGRAKGQHEGTAKRPERYTVILVIDDDALLRGAVKEIFDILDVESIVAASGAEGIDLFRKHRASIDTVMVDWRMPGMNGEETYRALRAEAPELPIVIASGDDDIDRAALTANDPALSFLRKPYSLDDLSALAGQR